MVTRNGELGKMDEAVANKVADGLLRDVEHAREIEEAVEPYDECCGPMPPSNTPEPSGDNWVRDLGLSVKQIGRKERDIEVGAIVTDLAAETSDRLSGNPRDAYLRGYAKALADVADRLFPIEPTNPNLCGYCGKGVPSGDFAGRCPECIREAREHNARKFRFESEERT